MSQTHRSYFNALAPAWNGVNNLPADLVQPLQRFGIRCGDRVLDLGSGKGILAPVLRKLAGPEGVITAMDIAEQMLQGGRAIYTENRILPLCADVAALPCPSTCFDKVVCFSTFPHFRSPLRALHEVYRVLRPGGALLIWHTCGSRHLNAFHARLNGVVAADHLPPAEELARLLQIGGYAGVSCRETAELYWVTAERPAPHSS